MVEVMPPFDIWTGSASDCSHLEPGPEARAQVLPGPWRKLASVPWCNLTRMLRLSPSLSNAEDCGSSVTASARLRSAEARPCPARPAGTGITTNISKFKLRPQPDRDSDSESEHRFVPDAAAVFLASD